MYKHVFLFFFYVFLCLYHFRRGSVFRMRMVMVSRMTMVVVVDVITDVSIAGIISTSLEVVVV